MRLINYLPMGINSISETILFSDENRVIISSRNYEDLISVPNLFVSYD